MMAELKSIFNDVDADASGEIQIVEFITHMPGRLNANDRLNSKLLYDVFAHVDVDESGEITWPEFSEWVQKSMNKHPDIDEIAEVLIRMFREIGDVSGTDADNRKLEVGCRCWSLTS